MARHYLESMLGEQEKIVLATRQHWFLLLSAIFVEIVIIFIIFAATVTAALTQLQQILTLPLIILIGFILTLLPILSMIRDILIYTNHQYIVTNRRVIQISGIINKNVIDSSLDKVNDVKMAQSFFGRIFDYGDVEILTASELGVNLFRRIEKPVRFKTAMLNAKEQLETLPRGEGRSGDIPTLIAGLDKLRQQGVLSEVEFQQKKSELLAKL